MRISKKRQKEIDARLCAELTAAVKAGEMTIEKAIEVIFRPRLAETVPEPDRLGGIKHQISELSIQDRRRLYHWLQLEARLDTEGTPLEESYRSRPPL
jgi:hypothetical protein